MTPPASFPGTWIFESWAHTYYEAVHRIAPRRLLLAADKWLSVLRRLASSGHASRWILLVVAGVLRDYLFLVCLQRFGLGRWMGVHRQSWNTIATVRQRIRRGCGGLKGVHFVLSTPSITLHARALLCINTASPSQLFYCIKKRRFAMVKIKDLGELGHT